jgi:hypothetical protein
MNAAARLAEGTASLLAKNKGSWGLAPGDFFGGKKGK